MVRGSVGETRWAALQRSSGRLNMRFFLFAVGLIGCATPSGIDEDYKNQEEVLVDVGGDGWCMSLGLMTGGG